MSHYGRLCSVLLHRRQVERAMDPSAFAAPIILDMIELRSFSLLVAGIFSASVPLGFEDTADAAAFAAFWVSRFSLLRSQLGPRGLLPSAVTDCFAGISWSLVISTCAPLPCAGLEVGLVDAPYTFAMSASTSVIASAEREFHWCLCRIVAHGDSHGLVSCIIEFIHEGDC